MRPKKATRYRTCTSTVRINFMSWQISPLHPKLLYCLWRIILSCGPSSSPNHYIRIKCYFNTCCLCEELYWNGKNSHAAKVQMLVLDDRHNDHRMMPLVLLLLLVSLILCKSLSISSFISPFEKELRCPRFGSPTYLQENIIKFVWSCLVELSYWIKLYVLLSALYGLPNYFWTIQHLLGIWFHNIVYMRVSIYFL